MPEKQAFDVTPFKIFIPIILSKLPQYYNVAGKRIDVHALINQVVADGKIDQSDVAIIIAAYFSAGSVPQPPAAPPLPTHPDDSDAPDVPGGVVLSGKIASIELNRIRAVLSGKRFPNLPDLMVDPNPPAEDAFNYGTAVTFEATLLDKNGNVLDTGKHGGVGHTKTTTYFCKGPDGSIAQIGPNTFTKSTPVIGAGGANYESTNGTNATFRFGFAETAVEGVFEVWAEEDGVKSPVIASRVS